MQVTTLVSSFSERFALLLLDTCLTLANVEELGEGAVDVSEDHLPRLGVEHGVALGYFSHNNPVLVLIGFGILLVSVLRGGRSGFKANRAHIVVVAVVDVSFLFVLQSVGQVVQCFS